jgi:apolipoprotein N-acyltransferase
MFDTCQLSFLLFVCTLILMASTCIHMVLALTNELPFYAIAILQLLELIAELSIVIIAIHSLEPHHRKIQRKKKKPPPVIPMIPVQTPQQTTSQQQQQQQQQRQRDVNNNSNSIMTTSDYLRRAITQDAVVTDSKSSDQDISDFDDTSIENSSSSYLDV